MGTDNGISSDMLASVVEATVKRAFDEAARSNSRRSIPDYSSESSEDSSSDESSGIINKNSKKYTLGKSKRSMSSIGLSSMAHSSTPGLSSLGGMGKRNSSRSRSSLSLNKMHLMGSVEEDRPLNRNTSEVSLVSALSRDSSGEKKKKKKSKKKKKDKEKKLKKVRSDGSVRSSRGKSKSKSKTNDEWVPQGPPVDMLTHQQSRRPSYTGVSTLATDGYTQELVQHKSHHHEQQQQEAENGGALVVAKKKKKKFDDIVSRVQQQQSALVAMGSQALANYVSPVSDSQTARQKFDARLAWTFEGSPPTNYEFESVVHGHFPGAVTNKELVTTVVSTLFNKGYKVGNTLLATSLCCDELARQLEEDFNGVYGNNFNLGGLAGFPFAGNTGFGAMSHHIPDDGYCLIVFGPHVGVAKDGSVGKVERAGIELIDTCCGSAVAASNYVDQITTGSKLPAVQIQKFTDFQQSAVQELILPHGKRLADAGSERMIELPYAIYDSQDMLLSEIIKCGAEGLKRGLALLGGIQINTGPDTPDYFHPLRFDYMNYRGEIVDNMLESLTSSSK